MLWMASSAAAELVHIPSVIISNFTFDSCYSYLSVSPTGGSTAAQDDEPPLAAAYLEPLVARVIADYAKASLLLRLPGAIPIPAFDQDVPLPAPLWTDLDAHSFKQNIIHLLSRDVSTIPCPTPLSTWTNAPNGERRKRKRERRVVDVPLITRPTSDDVYTSEARSRLLTSLGVPVEQQQQPRNTKILVVSFGGQSIPRPASRSPTPARRPSLTQSSTGKTSPTIQTSTTAIATTGSHYTPRSQLQSAASDSPSPSQKDGGLSIPSIALQDEGESAPAMGRVMTQDHLYLPGAPPALHQGQRRRNLRSANSTNSLSQSHSRELSLEDMSTLSESLSDLVGLGPTDGPIEDTLLPPGWIAIVCGLSSKDLEDDLPADFYAAPRDIYVPDLTAIADVLLGKLVRMVLSCYYLQLSNFAMHV